MAERIVKLIAASLHLVFAIGFLAPVFAAGMTAAGWTSPLGFQPLHLSLAIAGTWGLIATFTGRWI